VVVVALGEWGGLGGGGVGWGVLFVCLVGVWVGFLCCVSGGFRGGGVILRACGVWRLKDAGGGAFVWWLW